MAIFELISDSTYKIIGEITQEDIDKINKFEIRTNLVLQNTKGISSKMISTISNDNVYFSILGGLDYYEKDKYNTMDYKERTHSNPKGLMKILEYFEKIESEMDPKWTETQKCMYAYNALAVDMDYVRILKQDILSEGVTERGLNGILYNQLTCAGMAKTFKEMMDRLDIKCYYQNQRRVHAFNVVELDGKYRGIDVTWDCTKSDTEKCSFKNFGRDPNFYKKYGHQISGDKQEEMFELTTFTEKEIQENYEVIENAINEREKIINPFKNFERDRKRKFLPVDTFKEKLQEEKKNFMKLKLLNQFETVPEEFKELLEAAMPRYGFIEDYIAPKYDYLNDYLGNIAKETKLEETLLTQDIKKYYTKYFKEESVKIDDLIEMYSMIENMPQDIAVNMATLKAHLYTKIKLFADSKNFFKSLGISEAKVEQISDKAKGYLENSKEFVVDNEKTQHELDLDFLYVIVQEDIIYTVMSGKDYSEENLMKLMEKVKTNWKEAEFSKEEYRTLLDEALGKTLTLENVRKSVIDKGIGEKEADKILIEMKLKKISGNEEKTESENNFSKSLTDLTNSEEELIEELIKSEKGNENKREIEKINEEVQKDYDL